MPHLMPDDARYPNAHLQSGAWLQANRLLMRKSLAEFAHESLLDPQPVTSPDTHDYASYHVVSDDGKRVYAFEARRMMLRHWHIRPASVTCHQGDRVLAPDALRFILDIRKRLNLDEQRLPVYLEELCGTLYSGAYKLLKSDGDVGVLLGASFQAVERAMSEGHPGFVANNGRVGFGADDYLAYAPESGEPLRLIWLAVHRDIAAFNGCDGLSHAQLIREELDPESIRQFEQCIVAHGGLPADYYLMPMHPWQWVNKLSITFAPHIARRHIICVGEGPDEYQAQQSIRTLFNLSSPHRRYVKTALSILNMGFMRGLSPYYMAGTPAINDFIWRIVDTDPFLRQRGFSMLREVATLGVRHGYFEDAARQSPYAKMMSALWRDNPLRHIQPGQRLITMAALLHVDRHDHALLPAMIEQSGLSAKAWLSRYLDAYLQPLLHCFYRHDLIFMPHGENLILVLEHHVPVRAILKDIGEESALLDANAELPEAARRIQVSMADDIRMLSLFIDVFDGFLRFMAPLLVEHGCCSESDFWRAVADSVKRYQAMHPDLGDKFARFDLFAPTFRHSCLNRLQFRSASQMLDLADTGDGLEMVGQLHNPIALFAPGQIENDAGLENPCPA